MSRNSIAWVVSAAVSLLIPAAGIIVWRHEQWPLVLFVLWTAAAASFVVVAERRSTRRLHEREIERFYQSALETLSHHRHDWMNEMQILYGYLRLGKPDKAVAVVERIRAKMEQDSRISRLGIPKLAAFFLSFRTICDTMRLEVEVEEGFNVQCGESYAERLTTSVIGLVNAVQVRTTVSTEENVLRLNFRSDERDVILAIIYEGKLAEMNGLEADIGRLLSGFGHVAETERAAKQPEDCRRFVVAFPREERAV